MSAEYFEIGIDTAMFTELWNFQREEGSIFRMYCQIANEERRLPFPEPYRSQCAPDAITTIALADTERQVAAFCSVAHSNHYRVASNLDFYRKDYGRIVAAIDPNALWIVQLQGPLKDTKARSPYINPTPNMGSQRVLWEHLFVEFFENVSRQCGIPELYILPAEWNHYYTPGATKELAREKFKQNTRLNRRYNMTAEQNGYQRLFLGGPYRKIVG